MNYINHIPNSLTVGCYQNLKLELSTEYLSLDIYKTAKKTGMICIKVIVLVCAAFADIIYIPIIFIAKQILSKPIEPLPRTPRETHPVEDERDPSTTHIDRNISQVSSPIEQYSAQNHDGSASATQLSSLDADSVLFNREFLALYMDFELSHGSFQDKDLSLREGQVIHLNSSVGHSLTKCLDRLSQSSEHERKEYNKLRQTYDQRYPELIKASHVKYELEIKKIIDEKDELINPVPGGLVGYATWKMVRNDNIEIWYYDLKTLLNRYQWPLTIQACLQHCLEKMQIDDTPTLPFSHLMNMISNSFPTDSLAENWHDCIYQRYADCGWVRADWGARKTEDYDARRVKLPSQKPEIHKSIEVFNPHRPIYFSLPAIDYAVKERLDPLVDVSILCGAPPFEGVVKKSEFYKLDPTVTLESLSRNLYIFLQQILHYDSLDLTQHHTFSIPPTLKQNLQRFYSKQRAIDLFSLRLMVDHMILLQNMNLGRSINFMDLSHDTLSKLFSILSHLDVFSFARTLKTFGSLEAKEQREQVTIRVLDSIETPLSDKTRIDLKDLINRLLKVIYPTVLRVSPQTEEWLKAEIQEVIKKNTLDAFSAVVQYFETIYQSRICYPLQT